MLIQILTYHVNRSYDLGYIGLDDACSLLHCLRRWESVSDAVKMAVKGTIDALPPLDDVSLACACGLASRLV